LECCDGFGVFSARRDDFSKESVVHLQRLAFFISGKYCRGFSQIARIKFF
jgi:hypothetical protein